MSKIIHCCWFGGNKKSPLIKNCMESWQKYLPDFEVMEWNENNFDINVNQYIREAFEHRKWAFVSDYVRLWVLYNHGGIYLDTDVEVFKDMSKFLEHNAFTGFEKYNNEIQPITAVMGAQKGNTWIKDLLSEYDGIRFVNPDGTLNLQTNTRRITRQLVEELGVNPHSDTHQTIGDDIHIYPSTYFCHKDKHSYSMHHFNGSWVPKKQKLKKFIMKLLKG